MDMLGTCTTVQPLAKSTIVMTPWPSHLDMSGLCLNMTMCDNSTGRHTDNNGFL